MLKTVCVSSTRLDFRRSLESQFHVSSRVLEPSGKPLSLHLHICNASLCVATPFASCVYAYKVVCVIALASTFYDILIVIEARFLNSRVMASFASWVGRVVFFALIVTQGGFLAAYPAKYENNSNWYFVAASFAPALIIWCCVVICSEANLSCSFYIWGLYILALVTNIGIVFGVVGDRIDKDKLLGPNTLKMVLCITPLLLLLLLNTAGDSEETDQHRELVSTLSVQMAIDLFDAVDMIDIVLEENEHGVGISVAFGAAMIVVACFSLFLSPLQMAEYKMSNSGKPKIRFRIALLRNFVQIVFVNLVFLVIRAVVFFQYGKDASIFIAKNGIAIILSLLKIRQLRGRARCLGPEN